MRGIAGPLLAWFDRHKRDLPWRRTSDPYRIWVSEVMLQQTQVDTVLPYFERFMRRFPDLPSLAEANQQEVLALWEGLGYYSRARNLHKAAKQLMADYGGKLPETLPELRRLPGVGPYIAAAIASIAFSIPEPALDGNLRRVLARLGASELPLGTPASDAALLELARKLMPAEAPGDFNQALMDLGSAICLPKAPLCAQCPVQAHCLAFTSGLQNTLPRRLKKPPQPTITVGAAVILDGPLVLISRRPQKGLLAGLWEFPGGKLEATDADIQACIRREIQEELGVEVLPYAFFGNYRHTYTHFKLRLEAWLCRLEPDQSLLPGPDLLWLEPADLLHHPMGKVDRQISHDLIAQSAQLFP